MRHLNNLCLLRKRQIKYRLQERLQAMKKRDQNVQIQYRNPDDVGGDGEIPD